MKAGSRARDATSSLVMSALQRALRTQLGHRARSEKCQQRTLPPDGDLGQGARAVTIRKPVRAQSLCRQRAQSLPLVLL
jgi:hypothetical protein